MTKDWIEINAKGPARTKEAALSLLIDAGSPGVLEIDDKNGETGKLISYSKWEDEYDEPVDNKLHPRTSMYKAYLKPGASIDALKKGLKRLGWTCSTSTYRDKDWSEKWKAGLKPVRVTVLKKTLVVKPTWKKIKKKHGEIVVEIDPGMAFGTGGHHTTRMCLKAILAIAGKKPPESLLDIGTGTGVLAIAAKKLGFRRVVGVDIDRVAVKAARKNSRLNGARIIFSSKPAGEIPGSYDVVVANILAGDLVRLGPSIRMKSKAGGRIVLSGILKAEADDVISKYEYFGFKHVKSYGSGEWSALVFTG